jgi:hypothetical protein
MNKIVANIVLALSVISSSAVLAEECGKEVMGACKSKNYDGVSVHMRTNAVANAAANAKIAADEVEAHKTAQAIIAATNAKNKAAAEARAKGSVAEKVKAKLALN